MAAARDLFNSALHPIIVRICSEFARSGCDGLFLTAVSSDGIRLPVERIVRELETANRVWFVVVDGAQDFCHSGADLRCCDLYLTGAHKWLGAYHPLGIGLYGRRRTKGRIETVLAQMATSGDIDDPLLRFSDRLEAGLLGGLAETVSVASLFSCQGAVDDCLNSTHSHDSSYANRLNSRESIATLTKTEGCNLLSRILHSVQESYCSSPMRVSWVGWHRKL